VNSLTTKITTILHRCSDAVFISRWAQVVSRRPWLVIALTAVVLAATAPGLRLLAFNDDYRIYFSPENEDLQSWENLLDTYSRTDSLLFVVEAQNGKRVFSPEIMPTVVRLTQELWTVPYVTRVDSVANFQYLVPKGDELTVEDLVPETRAASTVFLRQREKAAHAEPLLNGAMLSDDGTVTAFALQMMIPKKDNAIADAAAHVREIQKRYEAQFPDLRVRLGGLVMLNAAFDEYARSDMATIMPTMLVVIVVVMTALFRSISATLAALATVFLTVLIAMGIAGYLGIPLGPHSSISPQVILTITIATAMHIILTFLNAVTSDRTRDAAVVHAVKANFVPISFTSLTTILGFTSMLTSVIPPFQHIGIMSGIGTLVCYLLSLTLLPSLLRILPFKPRARTEHDGWTWPTTLGAFVIRYHRAIVGVAAIALVPMVWGMSQLQIDDHFVRLFKKGTAFRDDADFIDAHLAGTTNIELSLHSNGPNGITDPNFLAKVERVKEHLLDDPLVTHVAVLTDTFKRINRDMRGGDPAYYRLPGDKETAAQLLLFYEMNLPFGLELNSQINIDKSALRLTATTKSSSTKDTIAFVDRTNDWLEHAYPEFQARAVSVLVMFSYMAKKVAINFYTSAFTAMILIFLAIALALRSWRLGLLSLVPNLFPIIIVFAIWYALGRTLDFTAALIFSMTFGVIVDDTVHFMHKYLHAVTKEGKSVSDGIIAAMSTVGPAIFYSTMVLSLGFIIFGLSNFQVNVTLGVLTALAFSVGVVIELVLTPALLMLLHSHRRVVALTEAVVYRN